MSATSASPRKGLLERLAEGPVICAEGYVFELERRGYLQAGPFVPEVVLDYPNAVRELHVEFVRSGSDVVEALTYYAHREKLRIIGKEHLLEPLNKKALEIAKQVAEETGTLVAGNICNTNIWSPTDSSRLEEARTMFEECVKWATEAGVDFIIGETFDNLAEALIALEVIKKYKQIAVITLAIHNKGVTYDGFTPVEACLKLEAAGADVVGLNCGRGPATMLPLLAEIVKVVKVPVAALPVPYRCTESQPNFQTLTDADGKRAFPDALDPFVCTRYDISQFTKDCLALGVKYIGVCCGGAPHHVRAIAEAMGRTPAASKCSVDMSKHVHFGNDAKLRKDYQQAAISDFTTKKD